jgi:hypothetical protein
MRHRRRATLAQLGQAVTFPLVTFSRLCSAVFESWKVQAFEAGGWGGR